MSQHDDSSVPSEEAANSFEALLQLAKQIDAGDAGRETYDATTKALVRCLDQDSSEPEAPNGYRQWPPSAKHALLTKLLLQSSDVWDGNVFLHAVCGFASANVDWVLPTIAAELTPVLRPLLKSTPPPKAAVLALVTLREFLQDEYPPEEVSVLHLAHFHRFEREDVALPYNVMFLDHLFHRNREDLRNSQALLGTDIETLHLAVMEWVTASDSALLGSRATLVPTLSQRLSSLPSRNTHSLAAARALLTRHLEDPSQLADDSARELLERLQVKPGFSDVVSKLASERARLVSARRGQQSRIRRVLMGKKAYQAAHVVRNELRSRLDIRLPGRRRPRVALCVSGQLRGFRTALEAFRSKLLPGIDYDTYVHAWEHIGQSGAEPARFMLPFDGETFVDVYRKHCLDAGHTQVKERYPKLFDVLANSGTVTEAELQQAYGTEHVVVENDREARFDGWSNSSKMHYKIQACSELAHGQGKDYDLVIRIRPDIMLGYVGFGWGDLLHRCRSESLLFAEAGMSSNYALPMMGDIIAIGVPETMRVYAGTYGLHPELSAQGLLSCPPSPAGHASLAYNCWLHGIRVEKLPVKLGSLMDPQSLSSATILDAVSHDAASRDDAWDRSMLAAVRQDLRA